MFHSQATEGIERIFEDQGWKLDQTSVIDPGSDNIDYEQLLNWVRMYSHNIMSLTAQLHVHIVN